jgi:ComF family protein
MFKFVRSVLDFIYPPVCLTCDRLLRGDERTVCDVCKSSYLTVDGRHPVWTALDARIRDEGQIAGLLSCYLFEKEGKFQEAMHLLKYRGVTNLGVEWGREIGARMMASEAYRSARVLIPVPLHKAKKRERGYNQCDFLCKGISEITGIPVLTTALVRRKNTVSQTSLNHDERSKNVGGAFRIRKSHSGEIDGRLCVLVDDIITTGSTLIACAAELAASGAKTILVASAGIAH